MNKIPEVVKKRLADTIPKFRKILLSAKERDINEADTVTIIVDMLDQVFGFDKYSEITKEYAIQGTYCDLAIKLNQKVEYLIEVKAIGLDLAEKHLRQAVNYASGEGIKWVVLTNGIVWELHRVTVDEKVKHERLFNFNITDLNPRHKENQQQLFLLCKRGVEKDLIENYWAYKQAVNHYILGAILLTEPVIHVLRRELKKFNPNIKISKEDITEIVQNEVIKRETFDSVAGYDARKQVLKHLRKVGREQAKKDKNEEAEEPVVVAKSAFQTVVK